MAGLLCPKSENKIMQFLFHVVKLGNQSSFANNYSYRKWIFKITVLRSMFRICSPIHAAISSTNINTPVMLHLYCEHRRDRMRGTSWSPFCSISRASNRGVILENGWHADSAGDRSAASRCLCLSVYVWHKPFRVHSSILQCEYARMLRPCGISVL